MSKTLRTAFAALRRPFHGASNPLVALTVLGVLTACGGGDGPSAVGPVARVSVSIGSVTLNAIGASQTATATARDANNVIVPGAVFSWTSDDATIAGVTPNGASATITAVGNGATVIRAKVGTISADIPVQVLGVRAIQVNPVTASIRAGDSQPFSATFDADAGVSTAVIWTSSEPTIATVSTSSGIVTGVLPGTAIIRATSVADPRKSAIGTILVTPARGVVLSPASVNLATAETRTLQVMVNIEAGLSTNVTWRSSAPAVATVSNTGLVRAVAFGTTTITAVSVADTLLKGTATINVVPVIRSVAVAPTTGSLFINLTQQLTATVVAEGNLANTVTWRSNNPGVVSVNAAGLATAVATGSATITALSTVDTTKQASATLTVNARPISVAIVQRVVGINPGTSTTLTANVIGDPGVSTAVTWTSSTPTVASVSSAGLVSAITGGTTLITATSQADISKRDTVTVIVVPKLATSWTSSRANGILYDDLVSVMAFNNFSAFAINSINGGASGGDIYRYDGTDWTLSASGSAFNTRFLAVQGNSANDLMAVGTNGVIARWNGTTWSPMPSGTTRTLRGVFIESATIAFAVGDNGTALRFDGIVWAPLSSGSTKQLNGVWSSGLTTFIVGDGGEVLRYSGTTMTRQTVPFADDINAISGVAGGAITAVGDFGGILRFDGTTWTLVNSNGVLDDFSSVSGNASNGSRMYIGGQNGVYQLNGSTLTSAAASYPVSVLGVSVDAAGSAWAVGQRGSIQRFSGSAWTTLNFAPDLLDVWTTSATNAWTVGEYGFIYRWNGSTWTRQAAPSLANLYTVWGASATDAFAGGDNGTMLRWNGSAWASMTFPSAARVFALWGSSSSNVFAVTDIGEILRFNGTTWTTQATAPGGATLLSVYGVSANDVYATGTGGLIMRFNGTAWSTLTTPSVTTTLFGVWMSGGNNIAAVGANQDGTSGFAYNFNGSAWAPYGIGTAKALTSVWGPSVFDIYATGDAGTILRYNGATWLSMPSGTTDLLWAISGAPDASGGAFAVGYNSTITTGSAAGASAAAMMSSVGRMARGSLDPSAAALSDRKASGPAPTGLERRSRAALAHSANARLSTIGPRRR